MTNETIHRTTPLFGLIAWGIIATTSTLTAAAEDVKKVGLPKHTFVGQTAQLKSCDGLLKSIGTELEGLSGTLTIRWGGASETEREKSQARAKAVKGCLDSKGFSSKTEKSKKKMADVNGDAVVNIWDLVLIEGHFAKKLPSPWLAGLFETSLPG